MSNLGTVLIAMAAITAIYAVAATAARSAVGTFATTETASHARSVEFAEGTRRAAEAHKMARAKCQLLAGPSRKACSAEARVLERKGFKPARPL